MELNTKVSKKKSRIIIIKIYDNLFPMIVDARVVKNFIHDMLTMMRKKGR